MVPFSLGITGLLATLSSSVAGGFRASVPHCTIKLVNHGSLYPSALSTSWIENANALSYEKTNQRLHKTRGGKIVEGTETLCDNICVRITFWCIYVYLCT